MTAPVVRWVNADTGEIKEPPPRDGHIADVAMLHALDLVPDVKSAIYQAWSKGLNIEISVVAYAEGDAISPARLATQWRRLAVELADAVDGEGGSASEANACVTAVREALAKGARP